MPVTLVIIIITVLCYADSGCEEHTTTTEEFVRRWPMKKTVGKLYEVKAFIRAAHSAIVHMITAAVVEYPQIQVRLINEVQNFICLLYTSRCV